jgi:hypothetical protein
MGVNVNPNTTPGNNPVGILSTGWDGNFSVNYSGRKNVRIATGIMYGPEGEDCAEEWSIPQETEVD